MQFHLYILKTIGLALLAGLLLVGCKSQQHTPDDLPPNQLIFGDGGGITGATTSFILLENGQIFKTYSLTRETTEVGKIRKKQARELLAEAHAMGMENLDVNEPGNMYYFLELKTDNGNHRCTWGAQGYEVDEKLQNFRQKLLNIAREAAKSK